MFMTCSAETVVRQMAEKFNMTYIMQHLELVEEVMGKGKKCER